MSLVTLVSRGARNWRPLLAVLIMTGLLAASASADEEVVVIPAKKLDRRFPQSQFCALPIALDFISPGSSVKIKFEAQRFVNDLDGLHWTQQKLDNVVLATQSEVAANFGPPPGGGSSGNCYVGDPLPTPYFYFNRSGLTFALKELFDTDPTARGWDMTLGATFGPDDLVNFIHGAPRDVEHDTDQTGGWLNLGADSASPTGTEVATTSILVTGLTPGESYDLSAWWSVGYVVFGADILTITVTTSAATPVARKSWGGLKTDYR